jgi:hypothetical protein
VRAWRALWRGDVDTAITEARGSADILTTEELRTYRALWLYFADSWAFERAEGGSEEQLRFARELKRELEGCARPLQFVPRVEPDDTPAETGSDYDVRAARAGERLGTLGIRGSGFERRLARFEERIADDDATPFELGVEELGTLLGFESVRPNESADPDSVWRDGERVWILLEAKTEVDASQPLSAGQVRQATTHPQWVANTFSWPEPRTTLVSIVTHQTDVHDDARAVAGEVFMVAPEIVRDLATRTLAVYREIRARAVGLSEEEIARAFAVGFTNLGLDNESLVAALGARQIGAG